MAAGGKFIGGIKFGVSMDTRKLNKNIKTARKSIARFVKNVKNTTLAIGGLSGVLGAVGLAKFTSDAFVAIDSLAKTSDKIGVTTEALAGLRLAAKETGAETATLDKSLVNMTKATSEAAQGVGLGVRAYKMLGLNAQQLNQLSPDKQFLQIADAVAKLNNKQDQLTVATQLFGTRGATLINTLRLGREGLNETSTAAKNLGLAVGRNAAKGVERAIDAFGRFKSAIQGIFRSIAVEVAPLIEGLSNKLTGFLASGAKGQTAGRAIGSAIVTMAKIVADGAQKAFAALLRFAAMGIETFQNIAASAIGEKLGLKSTVSGFETAGKLRNRAAFLEHDRNLPSAMIDKIIKANTAAAISDTEGQVSGKTFSALKGFLGNIASQGKNTLAGIGAAGAGIAGAPRNKLLLSLLPALAKAQGGEAAKAPGSIGQRGSLAFGQAGSAESFRQRARIRNQRDAMKLDRQRNGTLNDIKEALVKNPVVLAAAGLR